jgi:DNA-binding winged helix-turn-helix (wHTH) protein/TolB-like protein
MNPSRFRFGLFEFTDATRELRREGRLIRLQSQPAQVLSCLLARSGQVVSREELRQAVWGQETHVDFDRGLNFCIAQIRSALDDDSSTPRFVRTIPKRGYQFIAPVETIADPAQPTDAAAKIRTPVANPLWLTGAFVLLLAIAFSAGYAIRSSQHPKPSPILAIARFDNETGDPNMTRFSDGLTDTLVEQLTTLSHQRYRVIGNAGILRLPRSQRDLTAIANTLHAEYIVLGQVQTNGAQTRILAHLIRLPDQTHLWVARLDRSSADPLSQELDSAQSIAAQFSPRIIRDSSGTPLPPFPNR